MHTGRGNVGLCLRTSLIYHMEFVCDGSIFGDAVKLIVPRKGTINWCVDVTPGSRTPNRTKGKPPSVTAVLRYSGTLIYIFFYLKNSILLSLLPG